MDIIVKKSKINGKSVFAKRDFKKGEVILKWSPKKLTTEEVGKLPIKQKHYVI
jgi:SET domain-containing protein